MLLQQIPELIRWTLLFVFGTAVGGLANLAIYRLSFYRARNLSPWSPAADGQRHRSWQDRIPVVGWWFLRRESEVHGRGFWIRPMLIELAIGIGLVWFYNWQMSGGLIGHRIAQLDPPVAGLFGILAWHWFVYYSVLLVLLTVATFIDLDDQTIPDWITVPGTLFALVMLTVNPELRLPEIIQILGPADLSSLTYWSPGVAQNWHVGPNGLAIGIAIGLVWCFALMPKWITFRYGLVRGWRIMIASMLRPARKTKSVVPCIHPRGMSVQTRLLAILGVILSTVILAIWSAGGPRWDAMFDGLLGLAMGGGIVWAVRIVASRALGVEAMGFGDVTLMCMIGAFAGWQPALLVFVIAPFTSIVVALIQLISSGDNRLAFGPYLCLATAIVLIGWNGIWNEWAANGVFQVGGLFMLGVILVCLVLMAIMLGIWGIIKRRFGD